MVGARSSVGRGDAGGSSTGGTTKGPILGGPGQEMTAVNLNTNGASPGGGNTAAVAGAVTTFLSTLDATERDKVEYDFSENKARQTWSNFPATAVPREGIVLADLTGDHEIETLAREVGTSARTLSRLFAAETQLSFKSWCQRARIAAAIEKLSTDVNLSVKQLAADLGYASVPAFSHAFRQVTGKTPTEFADKT